MTTRHQAEEMDRLCRLFRRAEESLVLEDSRRADALMAAQHQLEDVLRLLRGHR